MFDDDEMQLRKEYDEISDQMDEIFENRISFPEDDEDFESFKDEEEKKWHLELQNLRNQRDKIVNQIKTLQKEKRKSKHLS